LLNLQPKPNSTRVSVGLYCKLQKFTMTGSSNFEISVSLTFYHEQDNELMDFPKDMRSRYSSKQNLYFPLECLVEFLLLLKLL
jgi:hypothetical protein